jgi:RNA polymerase sigma-70 factor (ECF subfamily)
MNAVDELIPTRRSLLNRLKDWDDHESWKEFFDTYWKLIYKAAIRAGLNDAEAQDVVQETILGILKGMPGFEYQPEKGSFKGWLLRLTSWRIGDQLRDRRQGGAPNDFAQTSTATGTGTETTTSSLDRVPDPSGLKLQATWDEEWEHNLLDVAIERVKLKVDAKDYQLFDLYVFKERPVTEIARGLKVSAGRVYLAKHRIGKLLKKEIINLRTKPIWEHNQPGLK